MARALSALPRTWASAVAEAKEIIDNYRNSSPNIQKYMDDTIHFAQENGYVQTLMGRKRWLQDIHQKRQFYSTRLRRTQRHQFADTGYGPPI